MSLGKPSRILYDLEDHAYSSTDFDSSDEDTLISHEPPLLPKLNKSEEHSQHQEPSYPTPTRQRPLLFRPKLLTDSSFKPTEARKNLLAAPSNPNPTLRPTPSAYSLYPPESSSSSGSSWLPSAYPRSLAEPHYHILPDDPQSQNTALSPPPWYRSRQAGKLSYEPVDHKLCPCPPFPTPNKLEEHPQRQKPSYPAPTRQHLLAKLQTHQVRPHLSQPKLLTDSSFKSIYAREIQPTAPSNPNPTPRPTPSTYRPHPHQSSSPSGSPCLPSPYPSSPAEPHYHILPDDLSSLNTALSPPPWHRSHQGGKMSYELMDHTFCP
jgi:hypothetical protein